MENNNTNYNYENLVTEYESVLKNKLAALTNPLLLAQVVYDVDHKKVPDSKVAELAGFRRGIKFACMCLEEAKKRNSE